MRGLILAASLMASSAIAQDYRAESLADIRQELVILSVEVQKLKQELNTTGAASGVATQGSALDRLAAMEHALQALTAKAEQLEFRVDTIVRDGSNQIDDLAFRLCELEEGCDISNPPSYPVLGGETSTSELAPLPLPDKAQGPELAATEKADFERAKEALETGDYQGAIDKFTAFNAAYPGGPLSAAADLARGDALAGLGDTREAAKAYLSAFSSDQLAATAPVALVKLGDSLAQLGKTNEACVTLGEVANRYPEAVEQISAAQSIMAANRCS